VKGKATDLPLAAAFRDVELVGTEELHLRPDIVCVAYLAAAKLPPKSFLNSSRPHGYATDRPVAASVPHLGL